MTLFIDFDRTIFDFESFKKEVLVPNPAFNPYVEEAKQFEKSSPERQAVWNRFGAFLESSGEDFSDQRVEQYRFPDVADFFGQYGSDIVIVTLGNPYFQELKVTRALSGLEWRDTIYVETGLKGPVLKTAFTPEEPAVFIDDAVEQLASVHEQCPWISIYEMRRDGKEGSGAYEVIRTFTDLEQYL